jgi:hypothetical protein
MLRAASIQKAKKEGINSEIENCNLVRGHGGSIQRMG